MHRRTTRIATTVAAAALVLGACDDDPGGDPAVADDPASALDDAVRAASDWPGVEATITADGDWEALAEADGGELPEGLEEAMDDASATIAVSFESPSGLSFDTHVDGDLLLGVRLQEGSDLLVFVDLPAIRDMLDEQGERELDQALGMAGMFGLGDVVRAFDEGDWVAILLPDDPFAQGVDDDGFNETFDELLEALNADGVEVEFVGTDEHGDRLAVTVDPDEVAQALGEPAPQSDGPVVVDVWIVDGEVSRLALDLNSVDDELDLDEPLMLMIDLQEFDGQVEMPTPGTTFDLEEVLGGFLGGGMDLDLD